MSVSIRAGGVTLPSPDEVSLSNEIVWSANTGRAASGAMIGDVVAEKDTVGIRWGVLTAAQRDLIKEKLVSGFFPVTVTVDGTAVTMTVYRGSITQDVLGGYGGVTYYRNVAVTLIQR